MSNWLKTRTTKRGLETLQALYRASLIEVAIYGLVTETPVPNVLRTFQKVGFKRSRSRRPLALVALFLVVVGSSPCCDVLLMTTIHLR